MPEIKNTNKYRLNEKRIPDFPPYLLRRINKKKVAFFRLQRTIPGFHFESQYAFIVCQPAGHVASVQKRFTARPTDYSRNVCRFREYI